MKRKQDDCQGQETVKRISSPPALLQEQYMVQPQQLAAVQLLTPASSGPILGPPTVGALTVPAAVAVTVQTEPSQLTDACILGGTITYSHPSCHSSPCNIVLASQPFPHSSLPVSEPPNNPNIISVSRATPAGVILASADNSIISYASCTTGNPLLSYSNATVDNNTQGNFCSTSADNTVTSYSYIAPTPTIVPVHTHLASTLTAAPDLAPALPLVSTSTPLPETHCTVPTISEAKRAYISRRNQESVEERQQRLTKRFDALIRSKIIDLVTARGVKKTVCPSEVARGLSPKAWRDLMPAVRKVGSHLVQEGIILVTQRGTIVDLSTAQGPVRFGLAK